MARISSTHICMAIETQRDTVIESIFATICVLLDVMKLNFRATELFAETTVATTSDECSFGNRLRKRHYFTSPKVLLHQCLFQQFQLCKAVLYGQFLLVGLGDEG